MRIKPSVFFGLCLATTLFSEPLLALDVSPSEYIANLFSQESLAQFEFLGMNLWQTIAFALLMIVIINVTLCFFGVATCYKNFNDMGISLAVLGIPILLLMISLWFAFPPKVMGILIALPTTLLLGATIVTTFKTNQFYVAPFMILTKIILSLIFFVYLWDSLAAKKRSQRGAARFVLIILVPLMLALVKEKEGIFGITSTGRITSR